MASPWHWRTQWGDGHRLPRFPAGPSAAHKNLDQPNTGQGCYGASLSFRRESGKRCVRRQSDNHKSGQDARKGAEIDVPVTLARDTSKYIKVSTSRDTKVVPIPYQPCRVARGQTSGSRAKTLSRQLCLSQWDDAKATEESPGYLELARSSELLSKPESLGAETAKECRRRKQQRERPPHSRRVRQ